jgi:hypothetical protein
MPPSQDNVSHTLKGVLHVLTVVQSDGVRSPVCCETSLCAVQNEGRHYAGDYAPQIQTYHFEINHDGRAVLLAHGRPCDLQFREVVER